MAELYHILFFHSFFVEDVSCFYVLSTVNNNGMNIEVQVSFEVLLFPSDKYSEVELLNHMVANHFYFLRTLHTGFHNDWKHSHQQWTSVRFLNHILSNTFLIFLIITILIGMR